MSHKLVGMLLVTFVGLADAHAATKLCIRGMGETFDVPENPSFIVGRERLARLRITRDLGKDAQTFPYRVERIDDYYARVTVDAEPGDVMVDPGFVGRGCKGRSFRVVSNWKPGAVAWTRTDWSYAASDLASGLYASTMSGAEPALDALADEAEARPVFVRTIRYLPDGTSSESRGWLDSSTSPPRLLPGSPPRDVTRAVDCVSTHASRTVPVDPAFVIRRLGRTPRFVAISSDGTRLPVSLTPRYSDLDLVVKAAEGTRFQLLPLPLGSECASSPVLHATRDRARDRAPSVVALTKAYSWSTNPTFWGSLDLRLEAGPWGALDLDWAFRPDDLGGDVYRAAVTDEDLSLRSVSPGLSDGVPEDFTEIYVRITPRWGEISGPAWQGWIRRDPVTGAFTFGQIEAPVQAVAAPPARDTRDMLVFLLLVSGLVVLAVATRRRGDLA